MSFNYRQLSLKRPIEQIRLLAIHAGDNDASIAGDLSVHDIETCPAYIAISYTWGDEWPRLPVQINGQTLMVRLNCWYTLWQMRYHGYQSAIWIDSICINQNDNEEKSAQVALMGAIYSEAMIVAACIGAGKALDSVREFLSSEPEMQMAARHGLEALEQNPCFGRIWIKQEVILCKDPHLFCGTSRLGWDEFEDIVEASKSTTLRNMTGPTIHPKSRKAASRSHQMLIEGRRQHWESEGQLKGDAKAADKHGAVPWTEFWRMFLRYGDSGCSNPHDKVYAVLPLLPKPTRSMLDITIDYNKSVLSLGLNLVRRGLLELAEPTTQLSNQNGTMTAQIWAAVERLFPTWLRLDPKDDDARAFIANRSVGPPSHRSQGSTTTGSDRPAQDPCYAYLQSEAQFLAQKDVAISSTKLFNNESDDEPEETEIDSPIDSPTDSPLICELSNVMSVNDVMAYVIDRIDPRLGDELDEARALGKFSVAALRPDLEVKVLFLRKAQMFLVPTSMEIGDVLLDCCWFFAHDTSRYLPIVRPVDADASFAFLMTDADQRTNLIGWALRLDWTGRLRPEGSSEGIPTASETPTFCLHYEDAALLTILKRDPEAYLTDPCTDGQRPSFLADRSHFDDSPTSPTSAGALRYSGEALGDLGKTRKNARTVLRFS